MFWIIVVALLVLAGLGTIGQNSERTAKAQEDLLYIARFGPEAYRKRRKQEALQQRLVNGASVFFAVLAITWLVSGCTPLPNYAYHASYTPNDPCAQYLSGRVSNDYVDCHARIREVAAKQREEQYHQAEIKAYHDADAKGICNSINPDGCLSPQQKQANMQLVHNAQDAAACEYGDQAACNRYPGGPSEAMEQYQQMKLRDCFMSFDGQPDYYGTKHLACR
jgi:hypothetical protein